MVELGSGILVKFLEELNVVGDGGDEAKRHNVKPVLLQIRSIIPVMKQGDFWPNQGFFLKVSDLSHALFVSLPEEGDEMVLSNRLQLGQLVYVDRFEAAYPLPMVKGIRPLPGRHSCHGSPKDLLPAHHLERFLGVSGLENVTERANGVVVKKNDGEKPRSMSASKVGSTEGTNRRTRMVSWTIEESQGLAKDSHRTSHSRSLSSSKASLVEGIGRRTQTSRSGKSDSIGSVLNFKGRRSSGTESCTKGHREFDIGDLSDVDSTISACSTIASKRKSWIGADKLADNIIHNSIPLPESKPCRRYSLNPVQFSTHDNGHLASKYRRTLINVAKKSAKTFSKESSCKNSGIVSGDISDVSIILETAFGALDRRRNLTDATTSLDFLPSTLLNLGQELSRKRDIAFAAAVDALQEAAAAEKTLKSLSAYSELLSAKSDDQHHSIDKFFKLQDDLAQSRSLVESLSTSISTVQTPSAVPNSTHHTQAEAQAVERKRNATSWIISALESDLSHVPGPIKAGSHNADTTPSAKRTTKPTTTTRRSPFSKNERGNGESHLELGLPMDVDSQPEWVKGSALPASAELANALRNECKTWFLSHVEDYLNWVSSQPSYTQSDRHVAEIMYQIKRVSDWLDMRSKDSSTLEGSELETCGRVRSKIYGILLKHVERTAINAKADW